MIYWVIGIIVYLVIALLFFKKFKWTNHPLWERIMLSLSWICAIPLYGIKKILRSND